MLSHSHFTELVESKILLIFVQNMVCNVSMEVHLSSFPYIIEVFHIFQPIFWFNLEQEAYHFMLPHQQTMVIVRVEEGM
jgi:hypothetical protein